MTRRADGMARATTLPTSALAGARRGRRAPSLDQRQYVELVTAAATQRPFEGGRARSPWIVGRPFLADEGAHHSVKKISTPMPEIYDPNEDTMFQPW